MIGARLREAVEEQITNAARRSVRGRAALSITDQTRMQQHPVVICAQSVKRGSSATYRVARLALSVLLRSGAEDARPSSIVVRAEDEARTVHATRAAAAARGAAPDIAVQHQKSVRCQGKKKNKR